MVKGTSKQAVIVSPGEKSGFEQAIFILSPQNSAAAASPGELLELAGDIASEYTVASLPAAMRLFISFGLCGYGFGLLFSAIFRHVT